MTPCARPPPRSANHMKRKKLIEDAPSESPSPAGSSGGRDPKTGRFLPGNKHGTGNPLAVRAQKLRVALFAAITPEDMFLILRRLVRMAKRGDLAAARLILDRCFGRVHRGGEPMTDEDQYNPDDRFL